MAGRRREDRCPFRGSPRGTLLGFLGLLPFLLAAGLHAQADLIVLKKGRPIRARVWEQEGEEVVFNVYRTGIRRVVHGTKRLPARKVKRIVPDPDPHRSFWRRAAELAEGSAEEWVTLGLEARRHKLKGLARHAFVEALHRDPENEAARRALGAGVLKGVLAGDPVLDPALGRKLRAYLQEEDAGVRATLLKEIQSLSGDWPERYLERAFRSAREKKGRTDDRILTLRSRESKGVYTLFVPDSYDPLKPTPLLLALHGGGRGGKDGRKVVGSGRSAMNFYEQGAARHGTIVVCPTAVVAPWDQKENHVFVQAVLDEIRLLFNVDENRIYLTGHSMGGFGAWAFGPRYAHVFAAIAPMSGGGARGFQRLKTTLTGVYLYHGADDPVVSVSGDRAAAETMLKNDMDFVYAEVPDAGHGFPREVAAEMWEFFSLRRLAVTRGHKEKGRFRISEEPLSSFRARITKDEVRAFGAPRLKPAAASGGGLKSLLQDPLAGGGRAEKAVAGLAALKSRAAALAVARILANGKHAQDTRRFAARALGLMGEKAGLKALRRAALDRDLVVQAAAFEALARMPDPANAAAFKKGVRVLLRSFEGKRSGRRMTYPDFEAHLQAASSVVRALAAHGGAGVPELLASIATAMLLSPLEVPRLERAGHDPDRLRRRFASVLMDALENLRAPASASLLRQLSRREDLGVQDRAARLLQDLST